MKSSMFIAISVLMASTLSLRGQDKSPIPAIGRQLSDYFSAYPKDKVFITTDETQYRPGEVIWFRAFITTAENFPAQDNSQELTVKLFNKNGEAVLQDVFRATNGTSDGDLSIPENLTAGNYFLVAYTPLFHAADRVACRLLRIDPQYNDQWVAETSLKDSISEAGKKNVLSVTLHEISGDVCKNTSLRYQFMNGDEVLEKGKIKTDEKGQVEIPLMIPEKTNGAPFVCEITDSRGNWKKEVWLPANIDPVVINFYPEGETRIAGVPSKIGFTAFNKWGIPVEIDGQIVDQDGKNVTFAKTFTKGLGLITLPTNDNQKLKFVVPARNQSFSVPATAETGLSLAITKTDTAFVSANFIFADQQKHPVSIVVSRAGNIYWAGDLEINGSSRIKIPAENLPQGINLLSVFDPNGKLLAKRILYTDHNQFLKIDIQPERKSIQPDKDMKVNVKLTNENGQPVSGSVTISVSDKFRNNFTCPDIEKTLLVGSELETPFSLISGAFQDKISNTALLDVFLLANKIKDFSWSGILSFKPGNAPDLRSLNNQITGVVTDKNGNKVNKAKVILVNNRNIQISSTTTNEEGVFSFAGNSSITEDYSVKATDQDGKHDLNVTYGKNFDDQLSAWVKHQVQARQLLWQEQFPEESYVKNNPFLFVKAPRVAPNNAQKTDNQRQMLESSTSILDVIKSIKPYKIINNQIVFAGTENSLSYQGGALIVIDGQQMGTDMSIISSLSPHEVDHINVSTNPMDIQRYTGLNSVGIIEIFLKKGKAPEAKPESKTANKYEAGFRVPNTFEPGGKENTTLLWIPNQQVDATGEFEFTVKAGKVISDFIIDIQGMTPDGRMGAGKAEFSVVK